MTTATISLPEFMLARIAEDEEGARKAIEAENVFVASYHGDTAAEYALGLAESEGADRRVTAHFARHDPARILAECEAKRPLIHRWQNATPDGDDWAQEAWAAMCAWAVAYADHPDYSPDWRP